MTFHHNTLTTQLALITGSASGIGAATARFLAEAGATVALIDNDAHAVEKFCHELKLQKFNALAFAADISDPDAMQKIADDLARIDIVVANAGINGYWGPLETYPVEEWDKVININLKGTFLTVKSALPKLKARGGSIIINASVNGTRMFSNTGATAYAASKAAQSAFAKMIALELAPQKIRVNTICPGSVETNIDQSTTQVALDQIRYPIQFPKGVVPLKKGNPATPEEIAHLIWFLASPASAHITGAEIHIDGAQSLFQG